MNPRIDEIVFRGYRLSVWRDDLFDLSHGGQSFQGNKARKLQYFLNRDFPQVKRLVSYGSAQSNMLLSLAQLACIKNWKLEFYVDHISEHLKQNPRGNYAQARELGAEVIQIPQMATNTERWVQDQGFSECADTLFIPEGGRSPESEEGIASLASEIQQWAEQDNRQSFRLMLPSGTGTTAFFLQKHLNMDVLTCPCVGDSGYLQKQFESLADVSMDQNTESGPYPHILTTKRKYHFGKLYPEFYQIWQELLEDTGIEFDLLYDPLGWLSLLQHLEEPGSPQNILYIHQGGVPGNPTMKQRYLRNRS